MPDGSPLQVTLLQPRSAPRPRGDAGSCSLGLIAGQSRELFGESRPRMRTLGGADFQTAGLRVCLPGNSHAGSAKVLSRRRRKRPEDRLAGLADPKGVFANRAEVLRALQRGGADRVQHQAAAAWSNSAQGEGKWHGHAALRTHSLPFWPKAAWRLGSPRCPMETPSKIRHPAPRRDEGLCADGFCQHIWV